ncbi:MAG: 4-amino-4-deoxy-L-arabinose transferase-like glycosyltransferase [Paracoccaceae bacterium]|jgi:4-amino-4-deoxy-L-arabinose transferase-like glycosyltransferase
MTEQLSEKSLAKLLALGMGLLLCVKLFLASSLDLYSDEIFYWLASTRPAIAYSDLPFMTALLVGLGSLLDSSNTLAVRSLFILLGTCIPLLIYWVALPITNKRQALLSALLALCIPMGGFMGLLAVPDVPLVVFGLLSIGSFERALRTDRFIYWLATGITVALGFSTHYRFFLYPIAALVFLIFFKDEHRQWRNPKFWFAVGVAAIGLFPIIWFNIENQLASANFYLVDRHPWQFHASGLLHIFKQAGIVTPPMYLLLGFVAWQLLRHQRSDRNAVLLACFALCNGTVYLVLAPWTDANSTSLHWPLSAYFPLLVFAPHTMDELRALIETKYGTRTARNTIAAIPTIGFIGTLVALTSIGSQASQLPLQAVTGPGVLSNKMAGWTEFATYSSKLIAEQFPESSPIIISDNYYTAGQIAFAGLSSNPLTSDEDKAVRDGRITQIKLWKMDESALLQRPDSPVLFITEDSTLNVIEKTAVMMKMCQQVPNLKYLDSLSLFNGDKKFSFYKASSAFSLSNDKTVRAKPCPFPPRAWIDPPLANAQLTGMSHIEGWAYLEDIGIESISLLIEGVEVGVLSYGISRPDVVAAMSVKTDPNSPRLGFSYEFDTATIPNGSYSLAIRITDKKGQSSNYGARQISVEN